MPAAALVDSRLPRNPQPGNALDFALGPQHEEIRRTVRDFAEREIVPVADELML